MMKNIKISSSALLVLAVFALSSLSCAGKSSPVDDKDKKKKHASLEEYEVAYFASGCFWCVEAIYESVKGVVEVVSGYSGGTAADATYAKVSRGITDHAETVAVYYDPTVIDYKTLLVVFFGSHDPTTLNRQGPDVGRHYRSAIFYQNEQERLTAEAYISYLLDAQIFPVVTTEVVPFQAFYVAEDYHQDFKTCNPNHGYMKAVSDPRFNAFKKEYEDLLKK
jgi:peptide-methionine (S)-S-oxide reductase